MRPTAQEVVAIILALTVLVFVCLGVARSYIGTLTPVAEGALVVWSDLIKVLIGGLIGYMSRD